VPVQYLPILFLFVIAVGIGVLMLTLARVLGPKTPTPIKSEAFECGSPSTGPARDLFSVKYYVTAILFLVFDIESVFIYPWAVKFRELGIWGLLEMMAFMGFLVAGLYYVFKKGALEWESHNQTANKAKF